MAESLVEALLAPAAENDARPYHHRLLTERASVPLEVRQTASGRGLFALEPIAKGTELLRDLPLAAGQHFQNKKHCGVCARCFRFVGSIESQIACHLRPDLFPALPQATAALRAAELAEQGVDRSGYESDSYSEEEIEFDDAIMQAMGSGSLPLPHTDRFPLAGPLVACPGGCLDVAYCSQGCAEAHWSSSHCLLCTGMAPGRRGPPPDLFAPTDAAGPSSSQGGRVAAGESDAQGRTASAGPRGLEEAGPSSSGAPARDPREPDAAAGPSSSATTGVSSASFGQAPDWGAGQPGPTALQGDSISVLRALRDLEALREFQRHADCTNDIFHVAAEVVSATLLSAAAALEGSAEGSAASGAGPMDAEGCLLQAWLPMGAAFRGIWWECVAGDEAVRAEVRQIAEESAVLLRRALLAGAGGPVGGPLGGSEASSSAAASSSPAWEPIAPLHPALAAAWPVWVAALTDPLVYSSIVSAFELNNLSVALETPVEDWFLHIDQVTGSGLSPDGAAGGKAGKAASAAARKAKGRPGRSPEQQQLARMAKPLLDALGRRYRVGAEGTAFYPLQSLINHSCSPSAAAGPYVGAGPAGADCRASVVALREIEAGEEVTISYIDLEEEDARGRRAARPLEERRADLEDYGFVCRCPRPAACRASRRPLRVQANSAPNTRQMLIFVPPHPLIKHWMAVARSKDTPGPVFRAAVAELGRILIYEAARDWLPTLDGAVETPMGETAEVTFVDPMQPVKVVPILRSGLLILEQASTLLPASQTFHLGIVRDEETLQPKLYLNKLPAAFSPTDRVLVADPMLATGGTICFALDELIKRGADPNMIRIVAILASPPALKKLSDKYPGLKVYAAMIDGEVNEKGFIVPGLGDAGDRAYGT